VKKERKHYSGEEQVAILRRHLLDKESIFSLLDILIFPCSIQCPRKSWGGGFLWPNITLHTTPMRYSLAPREASAALAAQFNARSARLSRFSGP